MDSSPRPQRRFSRWKTTKHTFVLGSVAFKPPSTKKQEDHGQFKIVKERTTKANGDKNDKIQKKNLPNHTTSGSVAQQTQQSLHSATKSSVVRRLCLDTSKETVDTLRPAQEASHSHDDPICNGNVTFGEERLHKNSKHVRGEKSVAGDPSLSQELLSHHERGECENEDMGDETAHQNNKSALSNISQNTSADKPSENTAAAKQATIQTRSSKAKSHTSLSSTAQSAQETGVTAGDTTRCKRPAVDDGESSDNSTDKENKDKDPTNSDVPPVIKKLKQKGALQNLSTSTANNRPEGNVSQKDRSLNQQNVEEDGVFSARRSTLRIRNSLASPKTMSEKRQYPLEFYFSERKSVSDKSSSKKKEKFFVKPESSFHKKASSKRQFPISQSKQQNTIKITTKKTPVHKNESQNKGKGVNASSHELKKQNGSINKGKSQHNLDTRTSSSLLGTPEDKQIHCTYSLAPGSSSSRAGLRDRSLLTSHEKMQQKLQYPTSYLTGKQSSNVSFVHSQSKHETDKKKQNKFVLHIEEDSPLIQSESSSSKNLTSNKYETYKSSNKSVHENFISQVSQKELSQQRKTRKMPQSKNGTETAAKMVNVVNVPVEIQTGSNTRYPDQKRGQQSSLKQRLKQNGPELPDSTSTVQSMLDLASLSTHAVSVNDKLQYKQKSPTPKDMKKPTEETRVDITLKGAKASTLSRKLLSSNARSKIYSLPRRQVKKSSHEELNLATPTDSFPSADISGQSSQLSMVVVDTSCTQSQETEHRKHSAHPPLSDEANKSQPVRQKPIPVTRPETLIDKTIIAPQKHHKKRKLLEEFERAEEMSDAAVSSEDESQEVLLWCEDGLSKRRSDVTAFDVILQAMMDAGETLFNDTEDGSVKQRLVRKVMRKFTSSIKLMITNGKEVKSLQHDIRQQSSRINKLMAAIKEQKKKVSQLRREKHNKLGSNQDANLIRYTEVMRGYSQLMQIYAAKSK